MATITAQQIIDRATETLYDETNVRWTEEELLEHLSDAQRASVLHLPEINPVGTVIRCASGTRQMIPADGFKLIDVVRNMGTSAVWATTDPYNGTTPGRAIRSCDRSVIDQSTPEWHAVGADEATPTLNFMYDTRDRRAFYVYPSQPQSAGNQQLIEIIYSAPPVELATVSDVIGLDDVYQPALLSYVLHRAYAKDLPSEMNSEQRSSAYFQQFVMTLMGQKQDDMRLQPRQQQKLLDE